MSRIKYNIAGEYKIMAMGRYGGKKWLKHMIMACYENDRKRSENLRKVNRDISGQED